MRLTGLYHGSMNNLLALLDYHAWATARLFSALASLTAEELARDLYSSHGGLAGTLAHLYGADVIWTARLCSRPAITFSDLPELPALDVLEVQWAALQTGRRASLSGMNAEQTVAYANLRGEPQSSTVGETVRHLVNHGAYHRGQLVTMLRQLGHATPNTDLIAFYRLQAKR